MTCLGSCDHPEPESSTGTGSEDESITRHRILPGNIHPPPTGTVRRHRFQSPRPLSTRPAAVKGFLLPRKAKVATRGSDLVARPSATISLHKNLHRPAPCLSATPSPRANIPPQRATRLNCARIRDTSPSSSPTSRALRGCTAATDYDDISKGKKNT